jgi:NAD(P)-dependent dehydrogenase (short-subunit alcohol dehydrogenase family)
MANRSDVLREALPGLLCRLRCAVGIALYTASRHCVIGLTRSLAVELGPSGVTVNCICPGPAASFITGAMLVVDGGLTVRNA